jgi:hypothetical protein
MRKMNLIFKRPTERPTFLVAGGWMRVDGPDCRIDRMAASRRRFGHSKLGEQTPKADIHEIQLASGKLGAVHFRLLLSEHGEMAFL